jgi:hypothetical protein
MSEYVRPVIAEGTYFDDEGRAIEYGNRPPDVGKMAFLSEQMCLRMKTVFSLSSPSPTR